MFGGNNSNPLVPISFGENHILDDVNALPQLQLLGDCEFFCRLIASYFFIVLLCIKGHKTLTLLC
jgi:hypothetical protein